MAVCGLLRHGPPRSGLPIPVFTRTSVANTALLYRLRQSGDWLAWLVGHALASAAPKASQGRPIRIVDATNVLKAGVAAKTKNKLWRIHSAFDLQERTFIVSGKRSLVALLEAGADIVVRSGWRNARWLDADSAPVDLLAEFEKVAARSERLS